MGLPIAIGLGLTAGASLFKGITGAKQIAAARRGLANLERPEYEIPEEVKASLALAQANMGKMPGYQERKDAIGASVSTAATLARESGMPLAAISGVQGTRDIAERTLNVDDQAYQTTARNDLSAALLKYADFKNLEFQMNEFAPYAEKYNEYREQLGAGESNVSGAIGDLGSAFLSASMFGG